MLEIKVCDQGEGITADIVNRLTDPFFTTRRSEGGTGLGLAVSSRILQEHGGRLLIDSVPGEGSVFRVLLPCESGA